MSEIFNRLGRLAKSVINDFTNPPDSDFKDAWSELDDFLGTEQHKFDEEFHSKPHRERQGGMDLSRDYANLEILPGADTEAIKTAYKKLLIKYHPDRFASDPEKQKIATEVTTKINESYKRIMESKKV